jgi:hypothetical protein
LSFSLEVLVGRVSPKKTQGSPPSSIGRNYWTETGKVYVNCMIVQ